MAIQIVLGKTPKTFKKVPVKFLTPEGDEAVVAVVFKYRTRAAYAQFLNEMFATTDADKPADGEKVDFEVLFAKGGEKTVEKMLDAIVSWDLPDVELNKENMLQLQNEYQASIPAFGDAYRAACVEGKLGN